MSDTPPWQPPPEPAGGGAPPPGPWTGSGPDAAGPGGGMPPGPSVPGPGGSPTFPGAPGGAPPGPPASPGDPAGTGVPGGSPPPPPSFGPGGAPGGAPPGPPGSPGQGFPQPGQGFGGPPPKKSKKPWFIGCGVLAFLGLLALGGCIYVVSQAVSNSTEATDAANDFLALLEDEDYSAAAAEIDDDCGGGLQVSAFEAGNIGASLSNRDLDDVDLGTLENDGRDGAEVKGTIDVSGEEAGVSVILVDDGGWKICSFAIDPGN